MCHTEQELGASFVVMRVGKISTDSNLNNVRMEPGDELSAEVTASSAAEVHPSPYTLHPTPCTVNLKP